MIRRRPSRPTIALVTSALLGVFVALSACSNQGEGERCNFLNGDEDCKTDEGLVCYQAAQLTDKDADRCCPRDRNTATNPLCKLPLDIGTGTDAAAPADSGPPTSDGGDGTGADAGADADAGG